MPGSVRVVSETDRELSVRTRPAGGRVASGVREGPPPFIQGHSRIVILAHGYNNSQAEARDAYAGFTTNLGGMYEGGAGIVSDAAARFQWPGDLKLKWASLISYPFQIGHARDAARRLADYLGGLQGPNGGPMQVDFVAHSLGCRMTLETIRELLPTLAGLRVRLGVVCLMAAAVEVEMLAPGYRLWGTLAIPGVIQRLLVLHSTGDVVLHYAFPVGQTAAGEGAFPTALGRFAPPPWVLGEHEAVDDLNHWHYWSREITAYHVAKRLVLGVVPQQIVSRFVVTHDRPVEPPPTARDLPEHRLPEWQTP